MEKPRIQWHSGFVSAIELEFSANRGDLEYRRKYSLNRKLADSVLEVSIGANRKVVEELLVRNYGLTVEEARGIRRIGGRTK